MILINGQEVKATVLPVDKPSLDETLETFSFALILDNNPLPFAPLQSVQLKENGETINFVISADEVELFTLTPPKYKHNITCVQNTRLLSHHLLRNSVFAQPTDEYKKGFSAQTETLQGTTITEKYWRVKGLTDGFVGLMIEKLSTSPKDKIAYSFLRIDLQACVYNLEKQESDLHGCKWVEGIKTFQDIMDEVTNPSDYSLSPSLVLHYTLNGSQSENVYPADLGLSEWVFNQNIEFPRLKELIEQGATDFYIEVGNLLIQDNNSIRTQNTWVLMQAIINFEVGVKYFYYTAYDILQKISERIQQKTQKYQKEPLFYLPTEGDFFDLLNNTISPNFTFTQATLYDCLAEVFRLFDGIFTLDENKVLGIEYFNDRSGEKVYPKLAGVSLQQGEERYVNGLRSYYQDARQEISFPSKNSYAPVRSVSLGVPAQADHSFIVDKNIQSVRKLTASVSAKVTIFYPTTANPATPADRAFFPEGKFLLDLTPYVIEESIWTTLSTDGSQPTPEQRKQNNCLPYKSGSNCIQLGLVSTGYASFLIYSFTYAVECAFHRQAGLPFTADVVQNCVSITYGDNPSVFSEYPMNCTYLSTLDGLMETQSLSNKYKGEEIIDQSNGAVDLNKLGLNMLGLSLKMGEPSLSANHQITSWADRIKTGSIYTFDGSPWVANICAYTLLGNGKLQGQIQFVKNFNSLSLRKQLNRERRFSNISANLITKSEEIMVEYVYYSSDSVVSDQDTWLNSSLFLEGIYHSFVDGDYTLSRAEMVLDNYEAYLPLSVYGAGNMVCFEMFYESPISAGNYTRVESSGLWDTKYFTTALKYTDDEGFLDSCDIRLVLNDEMNFSDYFPLITTSTSTDYLFNIENYQLEKQPNEVFALNYEVCFLPKDLGKDFIGSEFINNNFFTKREPVQRDLYLYYSDYVYSELDTKGQGSRVKITSLSYTPLINAGRLDFTHSEVECTSYSICDSEGNILFASNSQGYSTTEKRVYLTFRHDRL